MSGRSGRTDLWQFVRQADEEWERERLLLVMLDARRDVIGVAEVNPANLSAARLRPLLKNIPLTDATALIGLHNQPRLSPHPSLNDHATTKRLARVANELGVEFVDHLVFSKGRLFSVGNSK